jgi:hypothetical protein
VEQSGKKLIILGFIIFFHAQTLSKLWPDTLDNMIAKSMSKEDSNFLQASCVNCQKVTKENWSSIKDLDNNLDLYTLPAWEKVTEKLEKLNKFNSRQRDFLRAFYRNASTRRAR